MMRKPLLHSSISACLNDKRDCYRYVVTCESREIKLGLVARPNFYNILVKLPFTSLFFPA